MLRFSNQILPSTFLGNNHLLHPNLVLRHLGRANFEAAQPLGVIIWRFTAWVDLFWRPCYLRFPGPSGVSSSVAGLADGACHCRLHCLRIVLSLHRNMPTCGSLLDFFSFLFSFRLVEFILGLVWYCCALKKSCCENKQLCCENKRL
ncbi:hypothetical protein C1H46_010643 [Malus baccata]|uniref:Uncharacterized protein n=1 Tax=Malus baccata TaxID=106549 RepID=A0A540MY22_MALBA|nr:hypothetical protein C1H46_010643 [Malus baccata]